MLPERLDRDTLGPGVLREVRRKVGERCQVQPGGRRNHLDGQAGEPASSRMTALRSAYTAAARRTSRLSRPSSRKRASAACGWTGPNPSVSCLAASSASTRLSGATR
jgi:hypothetical protein